MNEQSSSLIDEFLEGRLTLASLESSIQKLLTDDPAAAPSLRAATDAAYRKGWLQPQVYQLLKRRMDSFDEPSPSPSNSPGRMHGAADDRTNIQRQTPRAVANDDTVGDLRRRVSTHAEPVAPVTGGSNWAHPEQWTTVHDAPVGPRSVIRNRFLLEERLGQGGMGIVYKALDRNRADAGDPEPYIAIKILNEQFRRHPAALVALQREAHRAQDLRHPKIVTVYDFERDGTLVYMTMELLDGQPLSEVIEANRFGGLVRETAITFIESLAGALAYAHDEEVVHCDLKPGNVFVTRDGNIKVFDFGIARALPSAHQAGQRADSFDAAELGAYTEAYASPEVLDGQAPVYQDDVFALGLVAYEMLTGRHPFERLRADEARNRKLKVLPIEGISRRRRHALESALAFERSRRQKDAGEFLRQFSPRRIRHWAYAGITAAALVAGYVFVIDPWIEQWVKAREFASLPIEQQEAFRNYVEQGEFGLGLGNDGLNSSLEYFSLAFRIHPYDPRATDGLEAVAHRIISLPATDDDRRSNVRTLYCQEYLATYSEVVDQCRDLFGTAQCKDPQTICDGSAR